MKPTVLTRGERDWDFAEMRMIPTKAARPTRMERIASFFIKGHTHIKN